MLSVENKEMADTLWQQYSQNRSVALREKLVVLYLSLVKYVTSRVAISLPPYIDREDMISSGYVGLIDAVEKFDFSRGVKFETYAVTRIRGAIIDALRAQDWVPASVRQKARKVQQVMQELENYLGRVPNDVELAGKLGITEHAFHVLIQQVSACTLISLDDMLNSDYVSTSKQLCDPTSQIENTELKMMLAGAIDRLPEKERLVVALYYYDDMTLKEIGCILSLTEARVSQLHTKAVLRLRGALAKYKQHIL